MNIINTINKNHPELKEGEVFLTNTANPEMTNIGWESKRLGVVAYDIHGLIVKGLYPVFKNKDEHFNI